MHITITDGITKRFYAACATRVLKMSQVVIDLVEQWLKNNETYQLVGKQEETTT